MVTNNFELALENPLSLSNIKIKEIVYGNDGDYVIVLHSYLHTASSMNYICGYLDQKNFIVINCHYPPRKYSIKYIANVLLKNLVGKYCTAKNKKIHFIGYSMGAIIIREFLRHNHQLNFGNIILISPPNHGLMLADLLTKIPFLNIILGPALKELTTDKKSFVNKLQNKINYKIGCLIAKYDFLVSEKNAIMDGISDYAIINATHSTILFKKTTFDLIFKYLTKSRF
jgi:esterase/lipase